jgi:hypothetical protein
MTRKRTILALALALLVAPLAARAQNFTLFVTHGIPGDDGIFLVDVEVSGLGCAIPDFAFGTIVGPLELPAGTYDITIHEGGTDCGNPVLGPLNVTFEEGQNVSLVAHLTESGDPTVSQFFNDFTEPQFGRNRVIVHHVAAAGDVDVILARRPNRRDFAINLLSNGEQVGLETQFGRWFLTIAGAAGGPTVLGPATVWLRPWRVTLAYAVGSPADDSFTVISKSFVNK